MSKRAIKKNVTVFLDTNTVFTKDWCWFISKATKDLIKKHDTHPTLSVKWVIPSPAFEERLWQLYNIALKYAEGTEQLSHILPLLPSNIDKEDLYEALKKKGTNECTLSSIDILAFAEQKLDWKKLVDKSIARKPPFSPDGEKGFKDAVIASMIIASVNELPVAAACVVCSNDQLFKKFISEAERPPEIASGLNELDEFLTKLSSHETAEHFENAKSRASAMFYQKVDGKSDSNSLYLNWEIRKKVVDSFSDWLQSEGLANTDKFKLGTFHIVNPTLTEQSGATYTWKSRIFFDYVAINTIAADDLSDESPSALGSETYRVTYTVTWSFNFSKSKVVKDARYIGLELSENKYAEAIKRRAVMERVRKLFASAMENDTED